MKISTLRLRFRNKFRRRLAHGFNREIVKLAPEKAVISFSFDDFPANAWTEGGRILDKYGVQATYYIALSLLGKEAPVGRIVSELQLKEVADSSHELGCHTFTHCHGYETSANVFEASILRNANQFASRFAGRQFETLSYPISFPSPWNKRVIAGRFLCARGCGQVFNFGSVDLGNVEAFFLEQCRDNPQEVAKLIQNNCAERGWLIFATHDISDTPTRFGVSKSYFEEIVRLAVNSGARVLPVAAAWRNIYSDRSAELRLAQVHNSVRNSNDD